LLAAFVAIALAIKVSSKGSVLSGSNAWQYGKLFTF